MPDQARPDLRDGLSRREVLKRAAIVGGVAWAAPVIQSITTPAFAQVTPPGCKAGCFWVKVDPGGVCEDANGTVTCPSCLGGATQEPGGCPCVAGLVTEGPQECTGPEDGWTLAPLPAGCTFLGGNSVCAGACGPAATPNPDGSWTFPPCPSGPQGQLQCVSHIEFCYCCS
jgi:hypothetical protein